MSRHPIIARLLTQRLTLGLTQLQVADALGVSDATVANWESGRRLPGFEHLTAWSGLLGLGLTLSPAETPLATVTPLHRELDAAIGRHPAGSALA